MSDFVNSTIVKANISSYFVDGEGATYDTNLFAIQVSIEGITSHTVERSVVDFVELDRRLWKKYPRSKLPQLPLDEITILALRRALEKMGMGSSGSGLSISPVMSRNTSFSVPPQVSGSVHATHDVLSPATKIIVSHQDRMGTQKIKAFNDYLQFLMNQHEIVVSDDVLAFLDEEVHSMSTCNAADPTPAVLSIHDLLLLNEPLTQCIVRKSAQETCTFAAQPGQMIVWSFSTVNYDIAFSIEINGEVKVPYTRYDSHRKPACGTLLIESACACVLKFDNSYAKWHAKHLSYKARVCSFEAYHKAKESAAEVQRERNLFELRRVTLRRAVIRHAASVSGVIHSSSIFPESVEQDELHLKSLEVEVLRLKNEVSLCHKDLDQAADDLEALEVANHALETANKNLTESWKYTLEELEASRAKCNELEARLAAHASV